MKIRYTQEGKKVIVIEKLNSSEWIVQEIFIIDNKETPSGEKFTVKVLHNAPAISWQEKKLNEAKLMYDRDYKDIEDQRDKMHKKWRYESKILKDTLASIIKLKSALNPDDFERLINVVSGNVTHVVKYGSYDGFDIIPFTEAIEYRDTYDSDIKLLTVYGNTEGKLTYRINQYKDGSGSSNTFVVPFTSYKEALDFVKNELIPSYTDLNEYKINSATKYKIKLPKQMLAAYYESKLKSANSTIEVNKKNLLNAKKNLSSIKRDIKKYS